MGAPSQTQFHNWTDRIAALLALDLAGYTSELTGAAAQSLARQIDASGDLALEAALMPYALTLDRQSLPERLYAALPSLFSRPGYRDVVTQLNGFLATADGGGHTNLRAALEAKSAVVHPLFAELARAVLGEGHFTDSAGDITTVFAPNYACRTPDRVYVGADGALTEETVDAGDVGTADVAFFTADNHALYIGSRYKFSQLVVALSTLASATISPLVEYWNGNGWEELDVTDNSAGLTKNDTVKWEIPSDWARSNQDKGSSNLADLTPLYYVRVARTADALVTPPVGTSIRIVPAAVVTSLSGSRHLGVDQPPLAICRITGVNTVVVEQIADVDYTRFQEPGLILRALTPISANVTPTLAYVDQDGNDASQAQAAWTSIDALDTVAVTLAGGDTGARNIRTAGNAVVTTATQGVFEVAVQELRTPAL